jgi:alkylation response protein AidB-like acyl-CoA dehydrogenase
VAVWVLQGFSSASEGIIVRGTNLPTAADISMQGGGAWLLDPSDGIGTFAPERLTEEHRLIEKTAAAFIEDEVLPVLDRLERKDWDLARRLLRRCGELGLLGVDIPEAYGGVGLDKVSSLLISERFSRAASFAATLGGQTQLSTLPLHLFGTEAQKRKYLPALLSGELVGAYALSEPASGSDALSAKTRAARDAHGSFVLNGEKMWITNGGFADVFIVFAKVDGEHFTAFIVERAFGGVTSGREEHKMGLDGSSTTAVVLQDVRIPASNLLGEIGKGHKVAFNVLNFGRLKLGAGCCGAAQSAIGEAATYAAQRRQFGQPIASFGAIRHKIGEMIVRTYAVESLIYRTAGLLDRRIAAAGSDPANRSAVLAALEEYAVESSIAKVAGSEALEFVLDENIQIHGGNGYVRDYPAERHYRDARVNRIFEGTNEINRLLISGILARRAAKGDLPLIPAAKALQEELLAPPPVPVSEADAFDADRRAIAAFKKMALLVLGLAMQTYGPSLNDQQEVLMNVSDILIDVFGGESAVLRAQAAARDGVSRAPLHEDAARVFVNDAAIRVEARARQALAAMVEGDTLRTMLAALRRLAKITPINTVVRRRRLADAAVANRGYLF